MHLVENIFKIYISGLFLFEYLNVFKFQSTYLQHMKNYENFHQYFF